MKNLKLSKQTIFTLLGIFVIVGSIPLAVLLVKQRQEIRKEAAQTCGQWCASKGAQPVGPWCVCGSDKRSSSLDYHGPNNSTSDCTSRGCYYGTQKASAPPPSDTRMTCGSWCGTKVGTNKAPLCVCGSSGKDTANYDYTCVGSDKVNDCNSCCYGTKKSGSTQSPGEGDNSASFTGPSLPVWHLYNTGRTCSAPKVTSTPTQPVKKITTPTNTPTPTLTVTPTITPTVTPTLTVTPTITVGCDQSCTTDSNCSSGLICSSGRCRNKDCTGETDCNCPGPTSTPTPTVTVTPGPTSTVTPTLPPGATATPTTTTLAQATPTPVVELPQAGFAWPTFGVIFAGMAFILVASLLFLL